MRYDRLHLLVASSLLVIAGACAPDTALNGLTEVSTVPSGIEIRPVGKNQFASVNLPIPGKSDLAYRTAWTSDGHLGMWFNEWSGVSLDGPFFQADDNGFNQNASSATALLLLRVQLFKSGGVPKTQLQPYVGIGPGVFFGTEEIGFQQDSGGNINAARMSIGVDLRAGMRWQINDKLDIVGEYRMTHYNGNRGKADRAALDSTETGDVMLTTNKFIAGLKLTF